MSDFAQIKFGLDVPATVSQISSQMDKVIQQLNSNNYKIKFAIDTKDLTSQTSQVAQALKQQQSAASAAGKAQTQSAKQAVQSQQQLLSIITQVRSQLKSGLSVKDFTKDAGQINELTQAFANLKNIYQQFANIDVSQYKNGSQTFTPEQVQTLNQLASALDEYKRKLLEYTQANRDAAQGPNADLTFGKLKDQMRDYWAQYGDSISRSSTYTQEFYRLLNLVGNGSGNIVELRNEWLKYKDTVHSLNLDQESFLQKLQSGFSGKLFYGVVGAAAMYARRTIRQLVVNVKEIDTSLNQLQIVTKSTGTEMSYYLDKAAESAQNLGASITDVIDSMTTFARLGYSASESSVLAEYTAMLTKVGDIDTSSATDSITALVKAFDIDVGEVELVMDQMVEVGKMRCPTVWQHAA